MGIADLAALPGAQPEVTGTGDHGAGTVAQRAAFVATGAEATIGAAVVFLQRVKQHRVLVVADFGHHLRAARDILAEAADAVVNDDAVSSGWRDHGRPDMQGDFAFVIVLHPKKLPLCDRNLAAATLVHVACPPCASIGVLGGAWAFPVPCP